MSVTEKQLAANRQNAQLAGVKTEEGKQIVRYNSFKHGLASTKLLCQINELAETEEQYLCIVEGLRSSLKPQNYFEESLIEAMAKAQFKMRRFDYLEASCFKISLENKVLHFETSRALHQLGTLLKYKQSLEAQYYRALEYLNRTRQVVQLDLFERERHA